MLEDDEYHVPEVYEDFLLQAMEASGATINRVATRSQRGNNSQREGRPHHKRSDKSEKQVSFKSPERRGIRRTGKAMAPPTTDKCYACKGPHKLSECRRIGPFIAMTEWLVKQTPARQKELLSAYYQNLKEAQQRYEERYAKRMKVRNTIRLCALPMDRKAEFLETCREETPDLDFGNVDLNFELEEEPFLLVDPTSLQDINTINKLHSQLGEF